MFIFSTASLPAHSSVRAKRKSAEPEWNGPTLDGKSGGEPATLLLGLLSIY